VATWQFPGEAADLYEVLGVGGDASREDIVRAYRRQAHSWHPDARPGDPALRPDSAPSPPPMTCFPTQTGGPSMTGYVIRGARHDRRAALIQLHERPSHGGQRPQPNGRGA
jgi:curved DNA-binding protein CbpA